MAFDVRGGMDSEQHTLHRQCDTSREQRVPQGPREKMCKRTHHSLFIPFFGPAPRAATAIHPVAVGCLHNDTQDTRKALPRATRDGETAAVATRF